jgi:hypothetical protein
MTNLGKLTRRLPWASLFMVYIMESGAAWSQSEVDSEETASSESDPTEADKGPAEKSPEASPSRVDLEEGDESDEGPPPPSSAPEEKKPLSGSEKTAPNAARKEPAKPKPARPKVDYSKVPWTYHQQRFDLGAGLGVAWVNDPAFDLFQRQDAHPTLGAHGAYAFFANGPLSVAATLRYETWGAQGEAREIPTTLRVHTGTLGGEVRYHLDPRVYSYGRLDLGAWYAQSYLGEADDPMQMSLQGVGFSGDLSLGTAVRVLGSPDGRVRAPRAHLFIEGGLGYDTPLSLVYEMSESGALRPAPVDLGALSLGGPRLALGAMVSY